MSVGKSDQDDNTSRCIGKSKKNFYQKQNGNKTNKLTGGIIMKNFLNRLTVVAKKIFYIKRTVGNQKIEDGNIKTISFVMRSDILQVSVETEKIITTTY